MGINNSQLVEIKTIWKLCTVMITCLLIGYTWRLNGLYKLFKSFSFINVVCFPKTASSTLPKISITQHQINHRKIIHLKGYDMTNCIIFRNQFSSIWRLKVVTTQNIAKNIEVQSLWNGNQWITEANELTMFISQAIYLRS